MSANQPSQADIVIQSGNPLEIQACMSGKVKDSALDAAATSVAAAVDEYVFNMYKQVAEFSGDLESLTPRDQAGIIAARKALRKTAMLGATEPSFLVSTLSLPAFRSIT